MTVPPASQIVNVVGDLSESNSKPSLMEKIMRWWVRETKVILAELISTTLLVFLGCMANVPQDDFPIHPPMYGAIAFGFIVLFNITCFGHISGAHMNPSVTLSAIIWGKVSLPLAIMYVIAQCGGAILGYGLLLTVSPIDLIPGSVCITQPHVNSTMYQALIIEIVLSAALGFINCAVWDPVNAKNQDAIPLKFGFTISALSLAGGPLTGGSMNPARSLGPAVWTGNWNTHWVYWVGPAIGGAIAPLLYKVAWLETEKQKESESPIRNGQT